jgi:hypothetical protein
MMVWRLFHYINKLTNISKATIRTFGWHAALNFYGALQALKRNSTDPLLTHLESSYQSKPLRLPFEVR